MLVVVVMVNNHYILAELAAVTDSYMIYARDVHVGIEEALVANVKSTIFYTDGHISAGYAMGAYG